jgi:two-component system sensor histidine kinase/response regulator
MTSAPLSVQTANAPVPTRGSILIVDDAPDYLTLLGELLNPLYQVKVATSGGRALELAKTEPPDLVLLDVMMPVMDGYAVLAELRRDARTREIPVIFATGLESADDEHRGFTLGASDYIVKPYNADIVLARVGLHVELKRARDRLREQNAALASEIAQRSRVEAEVRKLNGTLRTRSFALERSVADLRAFSYSVSHDLRAPLRAIGGFSELLAEGEAARLSEDGRGMFERIVASVRAMDRMIAEVLAYSTTAETELRLASTDLHAVATSVASELSTDYPAAQVDIGPLPTVCADAAMVRQIFLNLVGNAMKFSAGAARPRIEIAAETGPGPVITIRDNGVGFDERHANRLFGLFQRLHSGRTFAGTGVGLAIVKRLVERHGGQIRASSVPGVLTTFRFTLASNIELTPMLATDTVKSVTGLSTLVR